MAGKGEVRIRFVGETANLDKAMRDVGAQTTILGQNLNQLERNLMKAGATSQRAGMALSVGITAPLVAAGAIALKFASDFDAAMTQSVAIMGNLDKSMRTTMEKTARDVAKTTIFSAEQTARAYYYLASAGLTAQQSVGALPKVAAFAQAGLMDLSKATEYLTDSQAAMGLKSADAAENTRQLARVADVLTQANNKANGSVEQFAEALTTKAGAAMRTFGVDLEQGVAVLEAFAQQGIKGSVAGERFDILLRTMTKAAVEHGQAFRDAGIAVFDHAGKLRNVADIVADVEKAFTGMNAEQKVTLLHMLGIKAQSQSAILALVGLSGTIRDYEKDLKSAGGATEDVAKKQMESFKNQMGLLKKSLEDVGITLGTALMPPMRAAAEWTKSTLVPALEGAVGWFDKLSPSAKLAGIGIAGIAAAAGPTLYALGGMAQGVGALVGGYKMLAALNVTGTMGAWVTSFNEAANASGLMGTALKSVGVIAAALIGYKVGSWFVESTAAGQKLVDMISKLILMLQGVDVGALAVLEQGVKPPGGVKTGPYNDGTKVDLTRLPSPWHIPAPGTSSAPPAGTGPGGNTKKDDNLISGLFGDQAQHDMDLLTKYFLGHRDAVEGNARVYENLIKKVTGLHDAGAQLHPELQKIIDRMHGLGEFVGPPDLPDILPIRPGSSAPGALGGLTGGLDPQVVKALDAETLKAIVHLQGAKKATIDWVGAIYSLADGYKDMGGSASSTIGQLIGGLAAAAGAGEGVFHSLMGKDGKFKAFNAAGGIDAKALFSKENLNSTLQGGMAALQGLGQLGHATQGGGVRGAMGGATTGAGLGAAFGPQGAGVGAGVGAMFALGQTKGPIGTIASALNPVALAGNLFGRLSGGDKAGEEYAKAFGIKASDELKKQTSEMAKALGVGMKEASLLNLPAAIGESGKSASLFAGQVGNLMNAISLGAVPAKEGLKAVGESFSMIAADAKSAGSVGDYAMRSVIDRTKELGLVVPEVQAHVRDSLTSGAAGLEAFFSIGKSAADSQAVIFRTTFDALVGEFGLRGAAQQLGKSYEMLTANLTAAGIDASAVMGDVATQMALATNEGFATASDAARGLDQVVQGLANASVPLTITQFTAFGAGAQAAYGQAEAAALEMGMTHEQAVNAGLREVAPLLGSLVSASANYGVALDSNTASLVEQARAAGIAFPTDPSERLRSSIDALTTALGGVPPKFAEITSALNSMPSSKDITITTNYLERGGGTGTPTGAGPNAEDLGLPEYDTGTVSTRTQAAVIHGTSSNPEIVSPLDSLLRSIGAGLAEQMAAENRTSNTIGGSQRGDRPILVQVVLDRRVVGDVLVDMKRAGEL